MPAASPRDGDGAVTRRQTPYTDLSRTRASPRVQRTRPCKGHASGRHGGGNSPGGGQTLHTRDGGGGRHAPRWPDLSATRASPSCPGSRSPRRSCPRGRPARRTCRRSRSSSLRRYGSGWSRSPVTASTVTLALQPSKTKTCRSQDSARDQAHSLKCPPPRITHE